jgi:hypothetical protein
MGLPGTAEGLQGAVEGVHKAFGLLDRHLQQSGRHAYVGSWWWASMVGLY